MSKKDDEKLLLIHVPRTDVDLVGVDHSSDVFAIFDEAADNPVNAQSRDVIKKIVNYGKNQSRSRAADTSRSLGSANGKHVLRVVADPHPMTDEVPFEYVLGLNEASGRIFEIDDGFDSCKHVDDATDHLGLGTRSQTTYWDVHSSDFDKLLDDQDRVDKLPRVERAKGPIDVMVEIHNNSNDPDARKLTKTQMKERVRLEKEKDEISRRNGTGKYWDIDLT